MECDGESGRECAGECKEESPRLIDFSVHLIYTYAMLENISVIAFDIDGTLYHPLALYARAMGYFLRHLKFFLSFNKVRKILHRTAPLPDFYEYQARLLAEELDCPIQEAKDDIQRIVYDGLRPIFAKIKAFGYVRECFERLRNAGYRLALLSDFPPSQKGDTWGLLPYCELVLGSEEIGALKPSKYPFGVMAQALGVELSQILYVGNSVRYDVNGAKNAGMKTAYLLSGWRKVFHKSLPEADISFSNYRQFTDIVIQ